MGYFDYPEDSQEPKTGQVTVLEGLSDEEWEAVVQHAEHRLITSVLDGTYPPGARLPGERTLAVELGVTRPTLREILQRLARHGWLTIRHGKATVVNDYWRTGGMGVLRTLAGYMDYLPDGFFKYLLEVRADLLPGMAERAVERAPVRILSYLEGITDGGSFLARAKEVSVKKPVVVLKGGRTDAGMRAASSHTGAMAVPASLFDSACRQSGLVRVRTLDEGGMIASSFIKSSSRNVTSGRACPRGGTPPIAKPVCSRTNAGSARPIGSPSKDAMRCSLTRLPPLVMTSTARPLFAARKTSDLAMCATSQPTASAACAAVRTGCSSSNTWLSKPSA